MSDVILYKKQKEQLAKAAGKVFEAQAAFAQVLAGIGISPVGTPVKAGEAADAAPKKTKGKPGRKSSKTNKEPVAKNGSAFAEM